MGSTLFISNTFISNARLKCKTKHANAKQHPEAKLLPFINVHILQPRYQTKTIGHILKNK